MIRPYTQEDKTALIALLNSHIPHYFAPSEEGDFIHYLDHKIEDYFVVEEEGVVVGGGGINYFPDKKEAWISWDIVHPDHQATGVGRRLTQYRVDYIKENPVYDRIVVRTSQLTYKFYQKMDFKLQKVEEDYWGKGFDLYLMILHF